MIMDGAQINTGDSVFCTMRGAGIVTSVSVGFIGVRFGKRTFNYNSDFVWVKGSNRSLYWHDPVVTPPPKSSDAWNLMKAICQNMLTIFNNYGVE